ncbi:MAG: TrkH family potassium uptake protein [Bacillota bacterium]|nr:TrkH family potassium uptake protein [Bacillota bacterium]
MQKKIISILKLLSSLLFLLSLLLLTPLIVVFIYNEPIKITKAFIYPSIFSFSLGIIIIFLTRKHKANLDLSSSMLLCAIAWIIISFIGGLPFTIGLEKGFIDSFFESVSGFTTTGITVFQGLDAMSEAILFWRAFIQWLGGLGILTFFLFITFNVDGGIWQLFGAESHKINSSRPVPNIYKTITYFWIIYLFFTIIEIILLKIAGMPLFDSLLHSLTSLSTGGFSNHDASVGFYQQNGYIHFKAIEYIITFFMFLGGVNFLVHFKVLSGSPRYVFHDEEFKAFIKYILLFTVIIIFGIFSMNNEWFINTEEIFRKTIFQIISLMTTTGFGTEDIGSSFFPSIAKQVFILLMIIGGCVGSTSGGIKVIRLEVLRKLFRKEIKKIYMPKHAVIPVKVGDSILPEDELLRIPALVFGWIYLIIIGAAITALFSDLDAFQSFSGMASAVGNIGPFYFSVQKMASLSPVIKLTYSIGMLAGRLELIPIFILFNKRAWK